MSERWRGVLAVLTNPDLRAVLGESLIGAELTEPRRRRAVARLVDLGLVNETETGDVVFHDEVVRGILDESRPVRPTGPERYLDRHGRLDRYPRQAADLRALLRHIADRAIPVGVALSEREVNERLLPFTDDVAVLRRHLVDAEILERTRSGSEYARVGDAGLGDAGSGDAGPDEHSAR